MNKFFPSEMKGSEIVILGSSGFIGGSLRDFLSKENEVVALDRKVINLELLSSKKKLKRILNRYSILIIAAALTKQRGDNLHTLYSNFKIAFNIASVLEEVTIKKCVYLSSADVYGIPKNLPIIESTPINPKSYYSISKYLSEEILKIATSKSKTPYLVIRYNGIFGPGQKKIGYGINFFINTLIREKKIELWGEGEELRDCVYIFDLVKIIALLSFGEYLGLYNIATGLSLSYRKIIETLGSILKINVNIVHKSRTTRFYDQKFSIRKLNKILNGFKFTKMDQAIKETYDYYLNNNKM